MNHAAIDLGKRMSQICILKKDGELVERRVRTQRETLAAVFAPYGKARILLEAGTESEWVARCLEDLGHEVIVADPNYALMYARRQRRVKTDRRDARALLEACRLGIYRAAHRVSEAQRQVRWQITTREALVRMRARGVVLIGALMRQVGVHPPTGKAASFGRRVEAMTLPEPLGRAVRPLVTVLEALNQQIEAADDRLADLVQNDPRVKRLTTTPGVGPVIATTFIAAVDDAGRFAGPHQLEAYLGLVPSEYSSSERQFRGRITKAGNERLRALLVEGAWTILRRPKPETQALYDWARRIADRRGKTRAVVALARRLAGILFAMMRDGTEFDARRYVIQGDVARVA